MKSLLITKLTFLLFVLLISFSFLVKADQTITNIQSILKVQGYDIKIIDGKVEVKEKEIMTI